MTSAQMILMAAAMGTTVVMMIGMFVLSARFYHPVKLGTALIVRRRGKGDIVSFTGFTVLPGIMLAETMDITLRTIEIDRVGKDAARCKDGVRAEIEMTFWVRVDKTHEGVLRVAETVGCARAGDPLQIAALLRDKFAHCIDAAASAVNFDDLITRRNELVDVVIQSIGCDLNGFMLDDAAVRRIRRAPER